VAVGATMVMAPQVASTVPIGAAIGAAAVAERVLAEPEAEVAPMATAYPSPPPVPPKRRRRSAPLFIALGLILLLATGGVIAWSVFNKPVTLSVTPNTVVAGDTVVVSASHVPPNTVGEIQLWSIERTVAFRSDSSGNVSVTLDIPRFLDPGDHLIKVCWRGTCHATETIHVIAPVAFTTATPSPSSSALPGGSPTPTTHATPTATPRSTTTSTPTSATTPTPYITNPGISKLHGFYVAFHYFGGGDWKVSVVQLGTPYGAGTISIPTGNTYDYLYFNTPTAILVLQKVYVIACNSSAKCYEAPVVTVGA
ncbi:MAG TPA: hypothetical protein VFR33_00720, partial [Candidatus Dormibacteraeota bacterium]|nr:hypothetical protein [Candidatus Dormibacteraeota bacterium]